MGVVSAGSGGPLTEESGPTHVFQGLWDFITVHRNLCSAWCVYIAFCISEVGPLGPYALGWTVPGGGAITEQALVGRSMATDT